MTITEVLTHPLVESVAQDREHYHKQYTMMGLQELQSVKNKDSSVVSSSNNSGALFNIKPAIGNTLLDRNILIELEVSVTAAAGDFISTRFCPKSMPANRLIDTCNLVVNNSSILSEPSKYVAMLSQYKTNQEFIKKYRSLSPTEPDYFNRYENYDLANTILLQQTGGAAGAGAAPVLPADRATLPINYPHTPGSPFKNGTQCLDEDYEPRGAFPFTVDTKDVGTGRPTKITYKFTEPLLNPFCMPRENSAVAHVTDLSVQLNFTSNIDRAFSSIYTISKRPFIEGTAALGPAPDTNGTPLYNGSTFAGTPPLNTRIHPVAAEGGSNLTYSINSARLITKVATASIPLSIKDRLNLNEFQMPVMNLGANDGLSGTQFIDNKITVTPNTLRLSAIPSHVFIFARPQLTTQTRFNADAFLAIDSISLTCMNKTGILSGFTPQQLYNISVENGVNMSWGQWSRRVGSVLCLAFGKDIPQLLPGVEESLDFSYTITMRDTTHFDNTGARVPHVNASAGTRDTCTNDVSIIWELCTLVVTPSSITLEDGRSVKHQGISSQEAQDAMDQGPSMQTLKDVNQAIGGSFSDWIDRSSRKTWTGVKRYAGPIANAANALAAANPALAPLAVGANMVSSAVGSGGRRRTRGGGLLLN